MKKVLVATDFSPYSDAAIDLACDLAQHEGATLTLLHVCQLPSYSYFGGGAYNVEPQVVESIKADTERGLAAASARVAARGLTAESIQFFGEPAEGIVRFAREHAFELIVVGSHGRRGIQRPWLGSVAERVLRAANLPVLTARPPAAEAWAEAR